MQLRPASLQSPEPRRDDHGHCRRREDLGRREARIAGEEFAYLVPSDWTAGCEIVLDDQPAQLREREDRLPVVRPATVGEDEAEGAAAPKLLVRVAFEQLDVGNPAQSFASDRDARGVRLDRDDGARRLGEQRGSLAVGSTELGDVSSGRERAQQRLNLGSGGRAAEVADAVTLTLPEDEDDDHDPAQRRHEDALAAGLDCAVEVRSEEELERALEVLDPEIFLLVPPQGDEEERLEAVLELLAAVPAGKLAIADLDVTTEHEVHELERAGVDAVIVHAADVSPLAGEAPPEV